MRIHKAYYTNIFERNEAATKPSGGMTEVSASSDQRANRSPLTTFLPANTSKPRKRSQGMVMARRKHQNQQKYSHREKKGQLQPRER